MKGLLGIAAGIGCAIVIACGAARQPVTQIHPEPGSPAGVEPHAQIDALDAQITDELDRMGVARTSVPSVASCTGAACAQAMAQPQVPVIRSPDDPACRHAETQVCEDSCAISVSICGNAHKICELARQLTGDDWAANKCTSGLASCTAANERCCDCK